MNLMTPRTQSLLERAPRPGSCWTRRLWWGESLRSSEGKPPTVRLALALANVLGNMEIGILPGELIVGLHPRSAEPDNPPRPVSLMPDQDPCRLPEEREALRAGLFSSGNKRDHLTPNFPRLLAEGVDGVLQRVERQRPGASGARQDEYAAMSIALKAAAHFIERYEILAGEQAVRQTDPARRAELLDIAHVCRRIAHHPARTLHEAVQLLWFGYLLECIENGESTGAFALGRFDQILRPYWQGERERGVPLDRCAELIACFWVKLNDFPGLQVLNLTIGGVDREGNDAVNELSHVCLELAAEFRRPAPSLSVRWHSKIDSAFFRRAVELATMGFGQPAFYGDPAAIEAMIHAGVDPADAVDVVPGGCVELGVQGCCHPWVGNFFNLPKCLELALHDGVDPLTGKRLGPRTGTAAVLDRFDQLLDAYHRQVDAALEWMARSDHTTDRLAGAYSPAPLLSALIDDCIERGTDMSAGGVRYNFTEIQGIGIAHVVDSLLNLKKLVYENGEFSLEELVGKLDAGFVGDEPLRKRLEALTPAYGEHAGETASMARSVVHAFFDGCGRFTNPRGGPHLPGLLVWTLYDDWADQVGALPDGRRRGDAMVSSIGPRGAAAIASPTSVIGDATSFDHYRCAGGLSLNLRFDPTVARTPTGIEAIMALMETYFGEGGLQMQLNVVDSRLLKEARTRPEAHANLLVRVSGFTARFVELTDRMQEEIIARTELGVG